MLARGGRLLLVLELLIAQVGAGALNEEVTRSVSGSSSDSSYTVRLDLPAGGGPFSFYFSSPLDTWIEHTLPFTVTCGESGYTSDDSGESQPASSAALVQITGFTLLIGLYYCDLDLTLVEAALGTSPVSGTSYLVSQYRSGSRIYRGRLAVTLSGSTVRGYAEDSALAGLLQWQTGDYLLFEPVHASVSGGSCTLEAGGYVDVDVLRGPDLCCDATDVVVAEREQAFSRLEHAATVGGPRFCISGEGSYPGSGEYQVLAGKTFTECQALCLAKSWCRGFLYGTTSTGSSPFEENSCHLLESLVEGCSDSVGSMDSSELLTSGSWASSCPTSETYLALAHGNEASYRADSSSTCTTAASTNSWSDATVSWTSVGIDYERLELIVDDVVGATATVGSSAWLLPGEAGDCTGSMSGTAVLDLRNTPLQLASRSLCSATGEDGDEVCDQWILTGTTISMELTCEESNQLCTIRCGGSPGVCSPKDNRLKLSLYDTSCQTPTSTTVMSSSSGIASSTDAAATSTTKDDSSSTTEARRLTSTTAAADDAETTLAQTTSGAMAGTTTTAGAMSTTMAEPAATTASQAAASTTVGDSTTALVQTALVTTATVATSTQRMTSSPTTSVAMTSTTIPMPTTRVTTTTTATEAESVLRSTSQISTWAPTSTSKGVASSTADTGTSMRTTISSMDFSTSTSTSAATATDAHTTTTTTTTTTTATFVLSSSSSSDEGSSTSQLKSITSTGAPDLEGALSGSTATTTPTTPTTTTRTTRTTTPTTTPTTTTKTTRTTTRTTPKTTRTTSTSTTTSTTTTTIFSETSVTTNTDVIIAATTTTTTTSATTTMMSLTSILGNSEYLLEIASDVNPASPVEIHFDEGVLGIVKLLNTTADLDSYLVHLDGWDLKVSLPSVLMDALGADATVVAAVFNAVPSQPPSQTELSEAGLARFNDVSFATFPVVLDVLDGAGFVRVSDVEDPIFLTMHENRSAVPDATCAFWNETSQEWSGQGMQTLTGEGGSVVCSTSHLTVFALLNAFAAEVGQEAACLNVAVFSTSHMDVLASGSWVTSSSSGCVLAVLLLVATGIVCVGKYVDISLHRRGLGRQEDLVVPLPEHDRRSIGLQKLPSLGRACAYLFSLRRWVGRCRVLTSVEVAREVFAVQLTTIAMHRALAHKHGVSVETIRLHLWGGRGFVISSPASRSSCLSATLEGIQKELPQAFSNLYSGGNAFGCFRCMCCAFHPLLQLRQLDVHLSAAKRAQLFVCACSGSLLLGCCFLSTTGSATAMGSPDYCGREAGGLLKYILMGIVAALLVQIPLTIITLVSTREFVDDGSGQGLDIRKRQNHFFVKQDCTFWCFSVLWNLAALYYLTAFAMELHDLDQWKFLALANAVLLRFLLIWPILLAAFVTLSVEVLRIVHPEFVRCGCESLGIVLQTSPVHPKVEELAYRGISVEHLLDFHILLLSKTCFRHYDVDRSTTADVVRHAIIPLSVSREFPGEAYSYATSVSRGQPQLASRMVTHNWNNRFSHLLAAVCADCLGHHTYNRALEHLRTVEGVLVLRDKLKTKLHQSYWICAFSVNQHTSICSDTGLRDSQGHPVTPCCCSVQKHVSGPMSEINKFDSLMQHLQAASPGFAQVIAVDSRFELFTRIWCIAEIFQAFQSRMPQALKLHSAEALAEKLHDLQVFNVLEAKAASEVDRRMILTKIDDTERFNADVQHLVLNPSEGLISQWMHDMILAGRLSRVSETLAGGPLTNLAIDRALEHTDEFIGPGMTTQFYLA